MAVALLRRHLVVVYHKAPEFSLWYLYSLAYPERISPAVCFLLSPAASYITGATLRVDAGQSLYHSIWEIPDHNAWPQAPEGENTDTLREILDKTKSKL